MTKYVVAVSGGVDSVVLLKMLAKKELKSYSNSEFVVAHFDHGIRSDSTEDEAFVSNLAKVCQFDYSKKREELGQNVSEEYARERRYKFLREVMREHGAKAILTAHHLDDVIETIAMNLERGTGWRGLAVLDSPDVERPLLHMTKAEILDYAKRHDLIWREDSTNSSDKYLRNRYRKRLRAMDDETKREFYDFYMRQMDIKRQVHGESQKYVDFEAPSRHFFIMSPVKEATEVLRVYLEQTTSRRFTRPQLAQALLAVKTLPAGKKYEVGAGVYIIIKKKTFTVNQVDQANS